MIHHAKKKSTRLFYPRSPCGERLFEEQTEQESTVFSIHALLAESDARNTSIAGRITSFLSTLSLRRATRNGQNIKRRHNFLSTLSLRRATRCVIFYIWITLIFYPRSPCGERPFYQHRKSGKQGFSIHALLAESDQYQK